MKNKIEPFMEEAIEQSFKSLRQNGVPIGAVLVKDNAIVGKGHDNFVQENNPFKHAIIDCLMNAGKISDYSNTVLYCTLAPCHLCAGAIIQAKIPRLIIGEAKNFEGAQELLKTHGVQVINLDLEACREVLANFIVKNSKVWAEFMRRPN